MISDRKQRLFYEVLRDLSAGVRKMERFMKRNIFIHLQNEVSLIDYIKYLIEVKCFSNSSSFLKWGVCVYMTETLIHLV